MCFISPSSFSSSFSAPFAVIVNIASSLYFKARLSAKPLLWKCFFFIIFIQIKLIFTTEVLLLASFCKWEVLEFAIGNGLFLSVSSRCFSPLMILWSFAGSVIHRSPAHLSNKKMRVELMRGVTEPEHISSSAGRNDSGTCFLSCYACILYQRRLRVRGGELTL